MTERHAGARWTPALSGRPVKVDTLLNLQPNNACSNGFVIQ